MLLGKWGNRLLGLADNRHMITVAGTQAGKSSTVIIPNLRRYRGSKIITDPKGELAKATAAAQQRMGQRVYVLDQFGVTGFKSASYNPFSEIGFGVTSNIAADAALLADAMIINNSKDPHWTDAAKNLVRGIILYLCATDRKRLTLRELRRLLCATIPELEKLFTVMSESTAFNGTVANIGAAFLGKLANSEKELQSILSTAQEQTACFDDFAETTGQSDFKLTDLRDGNMTVYLVLPAMRIPTHYRWMRMMVQLSLGAMERAPVPRGGLPVWFVLEEFATLGHMRSIEVAAGLMAGYGVKLWAVLQDLPQLQTHYTKSWQTFLGNAGIVQFFGNADDMTLKHISDALGTTQVIERQEVRLTGGAMAHGDTGRRENLRSVRLLDPNEIKQFFARESGLQIVLVGGRPPIYMQRLDIERETP